MNGWENFAKYVGVQGLLALMLGGAGVYLLVTKQPLTPEFVGLFGVIVGFYFGKNGRMILADVQAARKAR